jgi:Helix-turn-helix domain
MNEWLTAAQAAGRSNRHVVTIWRAAEAGDLHGHQPKRKGRWSFSPEAVDAWVQGDDGVTACGCQRLKLAQRRSA